MRFPVLAFLLAFLMLGAVGFAVEQWEVDDNTLALYHCEDIDGTTVTDATGLYNGTASNALLLGSTIHKIGDYSIYPNASYYFVHDTLLDVVPENGTIEFWFSPDVNISTSHGRMNLFTKFINGFPKYESFSLFFPENSNTLWWRLDYAGYGITLQSSARTWEAGIWYHVSASWGKAGAKLYINGILEDSNADTSTPSDGTVAPFTIGAYNDGDVGQYPIGFYFDGRIDEIRVSNIQRDGSREPKNTTAPILNMTLPVNTTYNYDENLPLNYTVSDNIAVDKCWFNLDGGSNITIANCVNGTFDASKGSHILYMFANDTSGNLNNTEHVHFTVYSSSLAGCYELDRAGTIYFLTADIEESDAINCMDITANNVTLDCQGHLIEGINEESTYGIYINRGSATITNITVKNCVLTDWEYGVYLNYANNNTILNLTTNSNDYGISLTSSSNNTIINSTSSSNKYNGIYFVSSSNNQIINSTSTGNDYVHSSLYGGIKFVSSSNNTLIDSNSSSNDNFGIKFVSSSNNQIISSIFNDNTENGIMLASSSNNTITNSTIITNSNYGIYLESSSDNQIINSNSSDNSYGIYLESSSDNQIINSTSDSNNYGIYIISSSDSQIINSTSNGNINGDGMGIYLESSNNIIIINSTSNSNIYGIYIDSSNNNTIISSTFINNNNDGISLTSSSDNQIINSISNSNEYGIVVDSGFGNQIINSIFGNNSCGITLPSSSNSIIYNNLFNNTVIFEMLGDNNNWNTTRQTGSRIYSTGTQISGNYWTNSTGNGYSDTCTDADKDGFCDTNYTLSENNTDWLPLSDEYYLDTTTTTTTMFMTPMRQTPLGNMAVNIVIIVVALGSILYIFSIVFNPVSDPKSWLKLLITAVVLMLIVLSLISLW